VIKKPMPPHFECHPHNHDRHHQENPQLAEVIRLLHKLQRKVDKLTMTVADAIQVLADENVKLDDIGAKLTEGFAEIIALIGQLQNTTLTPEQETIVNDLKAKVDSVQPQAQQIADIVPGP
jgi:hypothetical protein